MQHTQIFSAFRALFPVFQSLTYIDVGSRAPLPLPVREKLDSYLNQCMMGQIDKSKLFELTEETRESFAQLINADADEVTFTKNISEGLNIVSSSMQWRDKDNVIVCPDVEHPNNIYHWLALRRKGVAIKAINSRNGVIPVDQIIEQMDERTRVVSVSSVTFWPGFRTDLQRLGQACRKNNTLLVVDAAQSVGILENDVKKLNIDVLAASTQKGLLSLYGMGFLYVRREVAETMTPTYLARFGVELDSTDSHESDFGGDHIKLRPGAKRFDLGNYNFPAIVAVNESLKHLRTLGVSRIDPHVTRLSTKVSEELRRIGAPVFGDEDAMLAHTVCVGGDGANSGFADRFLDQLASNAVRACIRRNMVRLTFHAYNNDDDIDKVVQVAKKTMKEASHV